MKRNQFILLFALVLGAVSSVSAQTGSFHSDRYLFDIDQPSGEGWARAEDHLPMTPVSYTKMVGQYPLPNIQVYVEIIEQLGLEEYYQRSQRFIRSGFMIREFQEAGKGDGTANGQPMKWVAYTHVQNGTRLKSITYYYNFGIHGYAVTGTAREEEFDKYESTFRAVAQSIRPASR